jgi:hypothetical protein
VLSRKNKRIHKSYVVVVKDSGCLSGANKTPLGNLQCRPQISLSLPQRELVFNRIEWLMVSLQGSTSVSPSSDPPILQRAKNTHRQHNSGGLNFQISKEGSKGHGHSMGKSWACLICSENSSQRCHPWAFYCSCSGKGHISAHCQAQWKKTGRKVHFQWTVFGNSLSSNKSSCSKNSFNLFMIDNLPSQTPRVISPSSGDTSLHISLPPTNSALPQLQALEVSPMHPRHFAYASKASPSMVYHHADPRPFAPRRFHSLEIAHREMMNRAMVCHFKGPMKILRL